MKRDSDSKIVCWTTMEVNNRGNKQKQRSDDIQPTSPFSKLFFSCSSSISIISCISKAASMKSYAIAPFSPEYSPRAKSIGSRGHSGQIISIIPKEAMRVKKGGQGFESQEPTSPKVSCIGQVKLKAKGSCKDKGRSRVRTPLPLKELGRMVKPSLLFLGKTRTENLAEGNDCRSLGQIKRFASRRESPELANFYPHSEDLVNETDECNEFGVFSEDFEECEVNLSEVIAELKSRTNSEIRLWEQSHVDCTLIPLPEPR